MVAMQYPITGVAPPTLGEVRVRVVWPSVAASPGIASLGKALTRTYVLAPLAWAIMGMVYFAKVMPFTARRYLLTNRRIMILRGWAGKVGGEVPLAKIREVKVVTDANTNFFRAADLHILGDGSEQPLLVLPAVPEPENFRRAILYSRDAWFPRAVEGGGAP